MTAAQAVPALGCGQLPALTHPQLALEGSWGMVPCPLFLSHRVPREPGHRVGAAGSLFLCTGSSVLTSEGLLGGKETQACLSPHVTCLHFFPFFSLSLLFFHFLKKIKKNKLNPQQKASCDTVGPGVDVIYFPQLLLWKPGVDRAVL